MEAASSSSLTAQFTRKTGPPSHMLHSTRKPMLKPWRKPVSPLPPNPTRVYKVKPVEFKDVVQKLTGAPEFQPSRLKTVAPAPLDLNLGGVVQVLPGRSSGGNVQSGRAVDVESNGYSYPVANNAMGLALSPSSNAWCSFLLMSPGSMSGLVDQSTVL